MKNKYIISHRKLMCLACQIIVIAAQIIAGYMAINQNGNTDQALIILSWFCVVGFAVEVILWKKLSEELLCPYLVFFSVLFIFSCGQIIGWIFGLDMGGQDLWYRHDYGMNYRSITEALYYSAVGISIFHFAALMTLNERKVIVLRWNANKVYNTYENLAKLLLIICIPAFLASTIRTVGAVAIGGYSAYYIVMEERSALFTILERISDYYQPCLVLLLIVYRDKKSIRNLIVIMMLIETVCQLYIGGRSGAVMTILGIVLTFHYFVKPFKGKSIFKLGALGYIGLAILNATLETRNTIGRGLGDFFCAVAESFTHTIGYFIGELGWTLSSTIWTMMLVPSSSPYRYGMSYLVSFLAPIPNLGFWEVHPAQLYANIGDWLEKELNYGHGIGYSMVAESYINFGWYGWAAMFLIGIIMAHFLANVKRVNIESDLVGATFQILIIMTIMKPLVRSSFSVAIRAIAYVLIPLYLLIVISLKRSSKSEGRNSNMV